MIIAGSEPAGQNSSSFIISFTSAYNNAYRYNCCARLIWNIEDNPQYMEASVRTLGLDLSSISESVSGWRFLCFFCVFLEAKCVGRGQLHVDALGHCAPKILQRELPFNTNWPTIGSLYCILHNTFYGTQRGSLVGNGGSTRAIDSCPKCSG